MTRQTRPSDTHGPKQPAPQAGAKIPDKPRDCGPDVDTWPILDEAAGTTAKAKPDQAGRSKTGR